MCLINSRSLNNKSHIVKDPVDDFHSDLCAITKTRLKSGNASTQTINPLCPSAFKLSHDPRTTKGGGTGLFHMKSLDIKLQSTDQLCAI